MKLFTRIMVVLMVLALALSVGMASAEVPGNRADIENLPECPEVPTMKVKSAGKTTTITLSAPLSWLNVVSNWKWLDIIQWNEDKTVGTYSTADLKTAPGFGSWNSKWISEWSQGQVDPANWKKSSDNWGKYTDEGGMTTHYYFDTYLDGDEEIGKLMGLMFGTYPMDFAYDGGIADGSNVKYTAGGKVASVTVTKEGENYLGSEKAPVKSEVTFKQMYRRMYVAEIKETFDDDSTITATFNFAGKRIKLH